MPNPVKVGDTLRSRNHLYLGFGGEPHYEHWGVVSEKYVEEAQRMVSSGRWVIVGSEDDRGD